LVCVFWMSMKVWLAKKWFVSKHIISFQVKVHWGASFSPGWKLFFGWNVQKFLSQIIKFCKTFFFRRVP
jgi:hypothetical protein